METFIRNYQLKNLNLCDQFIEYHKNNNEYKGKGNVSQGVVLSIKNSIDVTFFNNNQTPFIKEYFSEISGFLGDYMQYYLLGGYLKTATSGTNIQYYKANKGGFFEYHYERGNLETSGRQVVFMTYLNDVNEGDGGETEFYWQKLKVQPRKGLTILWPTDFTHAHRGLPCKVDKGIVTGWFNYQHATDKKPTK